MNNAVKQDMKHAIVHYFTYTALFLLLFVFLGAGIAQKVNIEEILYLSPFAGLLVFAAIRHYNNPDRYYRSDLVGILTTFTGLGFMLWFRFRKDVEHVI